MCDKLSINIASFVLKDHYVGEYHILPLFSFRDVFDMLYLPYNSSIKKMLLCSHLESQPTIFLQLCLRELSSTRAFGH